MIYVSLNVNDTVFEETVTYEVIDNESNVEIENGNTLKIINRDEIGDIVPVTAIFAVDDIRMTKTENIDIPEHKFPAEFDEDGFKSCYECGKEVYQSAEVVSDTHHPELKDHYADYYAIENAGQLYWFAGLVNGDPSVCAGDVTQNPSANAVLTKSITVNEGVLESDGTLVDSVRGFKSWTPIGNYRVNDVSYAGTFDGQGFNVSGLYCATDNEQVGFVGNSSGIIKNLGITDSYFNGKESVGAVCGYNFSGVIINCFSACYIDAAGNNAGGICGTNAGSISNCYNIGSVIANSDAHSICGKNNNDGGIIINCFFLDTKPGDSYATGKPEELFNSGEVAYLLSQGTDGESWGQKLGDDGDTYPVLKKTGDEGNTVYQYTNCEGNMSYTNDSALSGIVQNHDFSEQGICSNCNHEFSKSDLLEYISPFSEVVEADYSDATFFVYSNAKTEAELKNLRAQINPHFLLNTLNNIYALTAFDTPRAQKAIDELSRILRHVLYDNEKGFVSISEEVKFISDYVSLMRIRVAANVDIKFNIHIDEKCQAFVAPMIFISLVENAFKHGISATQDSFIGIDIRPTTIK